MQGGLGWVSKTSTHWKPCFQTLEAMFPTIGKDASTWWKQSETVFAKEHTISSLSLKKIQLLLNHSKKRFDNLRISFLLCIFADTEDEPRITICNIMELSNHYK